MLCGLTPPDRGTVRILGADPRADLAVRGRIGIVPQQEAMFEALTAFEFVRLAGLLHGVEDPDGAAHWALDLVEMDSRDHRSTTTYSKGMKQRVKVAQALVNDPAIMVLDEPLTGLDPRQRGHLIELFGRLGEQGRCVIVSSHVLDEVERFGSRVLVVAQGRLAATGDFRAIRDLMDDRPHRIRVRTDRPRELATELLARAGVLAVRLEPASGGRPGAVIVDTTDAPLFRRSVALAAQGAAATLLEVSPLDDDLDSVFRYLVGR
jgi:ABC-2 type transport system ATP-binding protein